MHLFLTQEPLFYESILKIFLHIYEMTDDKVTDCSIIRIAKYWKQPNVHDIGLVKINFVMFIPWTSMWP